MGEKKVVISYPGGLPPLPKQLEFHMDKRHKVKGLEGGFASGKSYCAVMELLINAFEYPGNEIVYGRLTADEINRTFFPIFDEMCPPELVVSHNKQERKIVLRTSGKPSVIHYMPLDDSRGAIHKIKSMNLGAVIIDQMEEISEHVFNALIGRLRRRDSRRQLAFNANPEGRNWIWRRFIKEKMKDSKLYFMNAWREDAPEIDLDLVKRRARELRKPTSELILKDFPEYEPFTDNPYLPIEYLLSMLDMPDNWKRRYLYGKHDSFEGLIYPEFDEKRHVIDPFETNDRNFLRVVSMDYGKVNPMSIHFWDIDPAGNVYCVDEIYQSGLEIPTAKMLIRAKNRDRRVEKWIADGSIWDERIEKQMSVGQLFLDDTDYSGWSVRWEKADRGPGSLNAGIDVVKQYLKHDVYSENNPKVYFFRDKCPKLIEEILDYRWKEISQTVLKNRNAPEVPRKLHDHAMDDMRYALTLIKRFDIRPRGNEIKMKRFIKKILKGQIYNTNNIRPGMTA